MRRRVRPSAEAAPDSAGCAPFDSPVSASLHAPDAGRRAAAFRVRDSTAKRTKQTEPTWETETKERGGGRPKLAGRCY